MLVESQTNNEAIPFRSNVEFDEKPRQLLAAVFLWGVVAWLAVAPPSSLAAPTVEAQGGTRPAETARARMTCYGILLVTVVYSVLNVRDGLMVRPHPAFWRFLHGLMLFYCMFLGALVMQSPDEGRRLIRTLLPALQLKPGEEDRDPNVNYSLVGMCELTWGAFNRQLFSKWFLAHLVGWCVKMMIYRDWRFCLCLSLFFELSELSLQWLIPEFQECWWDSVFMDFLGANMLGMLCGQGLLRILNAREYNWVGAGYTGYGYKGYWGKVKRAALQFTPHSWSPYEWDFFRSWTRFFQAMCPFAAALLCELQVFFLFHALRIPDNHPINSLRLVMLAFASAASNAEHYAWMQAEKGHGTRIGHNVWLACTTLGMEVIVVYKFERQRFAGARPPAGVWAPWVVFFALMFFYCRRHFAWCRNPTNKMGDPNAKSNTPFWLRLVGALSLLPLLSLTRYWAFE